jgi:hypothetical protein
VTLTWPADANIAANLQPDSPLWVPGINPDGTMSLSTASEFVSNLNAQVYLGISTWTLPITVYDDASCGIKSSPTSRFGYGCGAAQAGSKGYPYSELGNLFYNVLGGTAHSNILQAHGPNYYLFKHIQPYLYWSQTAQYNSLIFSNDFWFQNGFEGTESQYDSMYVIPVSVTATKPGPSDLYTACAVDPPSCNGLLPGLGLTTTVNPAALSLMPRWDRKLIYDPVTNVAYLANANLAATLKPDSPYYVSGINLDGSMDQKTLESFLAALNNPEHPYLGLTGWSVPTTVAGGKNPNCTIQVKSANPDIGYNCDGTASDLGELFYDQFGIQAGHTVFQSSAPVHGFFNNLLPDYYWQCNPTPGQSPSQCSHIGPSGEIPSFSFQSGYQGVQSSPNDLFVILMVPGNEIPPEQRWW